MQVGLMIRSKREDAIGYARRAAQYLTARGVQVCVEAEFLPLLGPDVKPLEAAERVEIIIALGGDGTLLRGMQFALRWDAALLGVNLGRMGFLTEIDPPRMEQALDAVIAGKYQTAERAMLSIRAGESTWYALNDAVLHRSASARLITIDSQVDGEACGRYVADGIAVATPTGSTGYSLSAGGPVVDPRVDCMVITPICAHSLQHRPAVVPGCACIKLTLLPTDEQTAALEVDGQPRCELTSGMTVTIRKAEKSIRLIRIMPEHFFQLVRDKLTEWSR